MRNAVVATCTLILATVIVAGIIWNVFASYLDRLEDKQQEQMEQIEAYTPAGFNVEALSFDGFDIEEVITW